MAEDLEKRRWQQSHTYAFMAGHAAAVILFYLAYNIAASFVSDQTAIYIGIGILLAIGLFGAFGYRRTRFMEELQTKTKSKSR